ncbi:unnamed protein product [Soboliphyme baturini]|uniref:Uncharacterized protein n=1 Tax=Soboliphyme baturini TaxID=241478 RepID=A0A183J4Z3_9BILA|nr:unnamed protein product [Soboliphyme baturini]
MGISRGSRNKANYIKRPAYSLDEQDDDDNTTQRNDLGWSSLNRGRAELILGNRARRSIAEWQKILGNVDVIPNPRQKSAANVCLYFEK